MLTSRRLRLRQFCDEDADAMQQCFANPEAMRFWNHPVHTKRIETERAVIATADDIARLTMLLGHAPRSYRAFAWDAAREWAKDE